ncbi:MAG: UDP-2,3-diacetamido-2,3-dideoxy-D-glucuronate 2-epimerase [bacterium ADurb.Bin429]|nr:MAG: UDP-2,3-diacetamido-2,3-dideoxy-D-glucuronate 2-epimerase [bacterium ADurb.Bin429]
MRILTVIGARPQFIKAAAVSRALRAEPDIAESLLHTGQHYDPMMSAVFFQELDIPEPAYHLNIGSSSHGAQTGRMLEAIEQVLRDAPPDWVLVYGDTNSTLAGALAAAKLHIPVAHMEAGLRSFNRRMPEELNRILTDHASALLFAPTETAVANLRREGITSERIVLIGDIMYDAARHFGAVAARDSRILAQLDLSPGGYALATIHRAENTDDPKRLHAIFAGLKAVAEDAAVVLPLHPRTRKCLLDAGLLDDVAGCLRLIEPVGYLDMVMLERSARLVVTDSGGVQKEAFFHGVPCVTLRDETEWTELVDCGWNRLLPPVSANAVRDGLRAALSAPPPPSPPDGLYGGGQAAVRVVPCLRAFRPR